MAEKLALNQRGVNALKELADAMPVVLSNILTNTDTLMNVYQSVSDQVGEHGQDFQNMLMYIKVAQEKSAEAISALPPMMRSTAAKMEAYIAAHPTVSGNS